MASDNEQLPFWRICLRTIYRTRDYTIQMSRHFFNITVGRLYHYQKNYRQLKKILKLHPNQKIAVFYPGYDWNMKMWQRPQHMAAGLANQGVLYFYCTINSQDNVQGFDKVQENLYVTNCWKILRKHLPEYTLILYANMHGCKVSEVNGILAKGNHIVYEYIDDLHEDLFGDDDNAMPGWLIERHQYVMKKEEIPVLCTAQHLFAKAQKYRSNNIYLTSNGVNYEDFKLTGKEKIPAKMRQITNRKKKILGYYGALASWFDYDLIENFALNNPDWDVVLIGILYDASFKEHNSFKHLDNVHYLGLSSYKMLKNYGAYCDVLAIPFIINDITLATSPVKVFEYMAMEKPVVSTALPECKKYKPVLIANNPQEFNDLAAEAYTKRKNKQLKTALREEALKNTWQQKALDELRVINSL